MFDQVFGLPLHVLVNHAVVVLVPSPWWPRWSTRWCPAGVGTCGGRSSVGAAVCHVSTYVAKESGQDFYDQLNQPQTANEHRDRAYLLFWILLVFFAVPVLAAVLLGRRNPLAGGHDRRGASKVAQLVVAIAVVVVAVVAGVQDVLTGDAGARRLGTRAVGRRHCPTSTGTRVSGRGPTARRQRHLDVPARRVRVGTDLVGGADELGGLRRFPDRRQGDVEPDREW